MGLKQTNAFGRQPSLFSTPKYLGQMSHIPDRSSLGTNSSSICHMPMQTIDIESQVTPLKITAHYIRMIAVLGKQDG